METSEIYSKQEIQQALREVFKNVQIAVEAIPAKQLFEKPIAGQWSAAENFDHLIRSAKPILKLLKMPKLLLLVFGKNTRASLSYAALLEKYQQLLTNGAKASGPYLPSANKLRSAEEMIAYWQLLGSQIDAALAKCSEAELDKYQAPHPVLAKLSLRELLFFTIFHSQHHLRTITILTQQHPIG